MKKPEILIKNGTYFVYDEPELARYDMLVIASALSKLCRFNGHTSEFYSVAQHSVIVSRMVPEKYALQGLLHDAHEAFIGDMVSPLKSIITEYQYIETCIEQDLRKRYDLPAVLHHSVKQADIDLVMIERNSFLPLRDDDNDHYWPNHMGPYKFWIIHPLGPDAAFTNFLNRYQEIIGDE